MMKYRYLSREEKIQVNEFRRKSGNNISDIRRKRRITLKKLGKLTGYRLETLDSFELGKKPIRIEDMVKIANALKVNIEKILVQDKNHETKAPE